MIETIRKNPEVKVREENFGGIIFLPNYRLFGLDEFGMKIWKRCDGASLNDLINDLEIPKEEIILIKHFLTDLKLIGAIIWTVRDDLSRNLAPRNFSVTPKVFPFSWMQDEIYQINNYATTISGQCSACSACG